MQHLKKIFSTPSNKEYFFGYYDKSPINQKNTRILAHEVNFLDRIPSAKDTCNIGFFDFDKPGIFNNISSTSCFNWQQGSMLQWIGPDHSNKVIFNDKDPLGNKFISKIIDIETREELELPLPIYSIDSMGKNAFSIDFERHYWFRRGYAYAGIKKVEKSISFDPSDGISVLRIDSGESKQIVSLKELYEFHYLSSMQGADHYVEHVMPNKSGTKIAFLHRWKFESGIHARLIVSNVDGTNQKIINDSGRISHFNWKNDSEIVAWGAVENPFNRMRKVAGLNKFFIKPLLPLYKKLISRNSLQGNSKISSLISGDSYLLIDVNAETTMPFGQNSLIQDGHPSISPADLNLMLSDTYPNNDSKCKFFIYDLKSSTIIAEQELKSIKHFDNTPLRCDLHPKWSYDGSMVAVDTMDQGSRGIYVYKVS